MWAACLAPRGASGLKSVGLAAADGADMSRPARGEWIEIGQSAPDPHRQQSRPARGEWIEIGKSAKRPQGHGVSPREGRVD